MQPETSSFDAEIAALRAAYVERLRGTLSELNAESIRLGTAEDMRPVRNLRHIAHGLVGSGATFGFPAVGSAAAPLETSTQAIIDSGSPPNPDERSDIQAKLDSLVEAIRTAVEGTAAPANAGDAQAEAAPATSREERRTVLLIGLGIELTEALAGELQIVGLEPQVAASLAGAAEAARQSRPSLLVLDDMVDPDDGRWLEDLATLRRTVGSAVPFVALSARTDIRTRLAAVKAGGLAFFPKPVDTSTLVDTVSRLTRPLAEDAYKVLVVDDDPILAATYGSELRAAGSIVRTISDPMQVMEVLAEFGPDVVLMDLYMPGCDGHDLAQVIRQQPEYHGTPILFLSTETSVNRQLVARQMGGDDFLTKPITPVQLVSAVRSRAQRYRALRALMERDALTGLLNHTRLAQLLEAERSAAQRRGETVTFAMIDIDYFKKVNDTYGHPAGDRVLVALSRLLRYRLRRTDGIGRYGGEEFAAVLPGTDEAQARDLIDEIRLTFAAQKHKAGDGEFSCTLSAGLATFPTHRDAKSMVQAADEALYAAKRGGRNQVRVAGAG